MTQQHSIIINWLLQKYNLNDILRGVHYTSIISQSYSVPIQYTLGLKFANKMSSLCGRFKFSSEENHANFLKAMGAPEDMVQKVVANLTQVN